ncbi:hypothetical protein P588_01512, partial [Staphylococcus aureus M1455]
MCNDTLELLRIKDENIKYINQEIDVIIKGKKATVVNAVLTYKPSACYCCGVKNEGQILGLYILYFHLLFLVILRYH